jgi:hypothetical protein
MEFRTEAEMKKTRLSQWMLFGLLLMLTACQAAGQPLSAALVRSGDAIDGMSLGTGAADAPPLWAFCSASQGGSHIQTFNCRAPLLPTLAIGHIFLLTEEVLADLSWSELVWELSINDQPVDLESFGTFEYVMPAMAESPSPVREIFKKATAWNIVLTNLNPGEHTLRFAAQNETNSYTWFINLVIEAADGTDISSIPFQLKS